MLLIICTLPAPAAARLGTTPLLVTDVTRGPRNASAPAACPLLPVAAPRPMGDHTTAPPAWKASVHGTHTAPWSDSSRAAEVVDARHSRLPPAAHGRPFLSRRCSCCCWWWCMVVAVKEEEEADAMLLSLPDSTTALVRSALTPPSSALKPRPWRCMAVFPVREAATRQRVRLRCQPRGLRASPSSRAVILAAGLGARAFTLYHTPDPKGSTALL